MSKLMTLEERKAARRRCRATTSNWVMEGPNESEQWIIKSNNLMFAAGCRFSDNGKFIVNAHVDLPKALTTIDALEANNAYLKEQVSDLGRMLDEVRKQACLKMHWEDFDSVLESFNKMMTARDAWKRYALTLDAWQEHCVVCEHCHISAYQCEDGERLLRGEFDEARKAVDGL